MRKLVQESKNLNDFINKILIGDSRKLLKLIPDNSIHLIITSPPYWNAVTYDNENFIGNSSYEKYIADLLIVWKECERILVPNGKLCIVSPLMPIPKKLINTQHTRHIKNINTDIEFSILKETNLKRYDMYIWQKQTSKLIFGSYPYPGNIYAQNTIEFINIFVKDGEPLKRDKLLKEKNKISQEEWRDLTQQVWFIYPKDVKRRQGHPAPFPEKLIARLIKMFTFGRCDECNFPGDIVLDPFAGIGTTLKVAKQMGRRWIGIELSETYASIAMEEIEKTELNPDSVNVFIGFPKYPNREECNRIFLNNRKQKDKNLLGKKHKKINYGRKIPIEKKKELNSKF